LHAFVEGEHLRRGVRDVRRIHCECQQMILAESKVYVFQVVEAAPKQPGPDYEQKAQTHLQRYQGLTQAGPRSASENSRRLLLQRRCEVPCRGLNRGGKTK